MSELHHIFSLYRKESDGKIPRNMRKTFRWILLVIGRTKWLVLLLVFLTMLQSSCFVINALFLKGLIDGAVAHSSEKFFFFLSLFCGTIFFLILLRVTENWLFEYTSAVTENCFKKRLFAALLHKDYPSVTAVHTGEWINRLTSDTAVVADNLATLFPWLAGMLVRIAGALIVICTIVPWLGIIVLIGGFLLILITASFKFVFKRLHKRIREADGNLRIFLSERLGNLLVVRLFGNRELNENQFDLMADTHKQRRLERMFFSNLCGSIIGILRDGAYLTGIIVCGFGILNGTISYGTFAAVTKLVMQIQFPLTSVVGYIPRYFSMTASAERLMEAEEFADDLPEGTALIPVPEIKQFYENEFQSLGLRGATFVYRSLSDTDDKNPLVLNRFNLEIDKGDCIAFTGPSGCGKTTVLKILMGFYKLDSGEAFLKAAKKEEPLTSARRNLFAYVPQGNLLINDTIRNVVVMGNPEAKHDEAAIYRALEIACADQFVLELEKGIDTLLGERGSGLSEGQMQRIAIARAVFTDRPILLLDEATSALDEMTENRLLKNIKEMTNKTIVTVTHRSSVLAICNKEFSFQ